jgi:DNA-binding MarR family transcriptional regulator
MLAVIAGRMAADRVESALGPLRLTLRHFGALGHLASQPNLSYSDLARRVGVTSQTMRDTVAHLESIGAVRTAGKGQGHASQLTVTAAGRRLLDRARAAVLTLDHELDAELGATNSTDTAAMLMQLVMALRRLDDESRVRPD